MSRKLASRVFPVALVFPLLSCGRSQHKADEMYYVVRANSKLPYWQTAASGLLDAAAQLDVKAEMVGPDTYDTKGEREAFQRILARKPSDILVSAADPVVMTPAIDAAIAQGVPVITMDSDAPASKRLLFIGTDNFEAGRTAGQVATKRLGGKGNVFFFTMPEQHNLKERLNGYLDAFANAPDIHIAEIVDIKDDVRVAFDRTMDLVERGSHSVDAFVCLEASACAHVADLSESLRCIWLNRQSSPSAILSGGPFSQFLRIAKISSAAGLLFVAKQGGAANEVRGDPFQFRFAAFRPRFFEADPEMAINRSIRLGFSQLDHYARPPAVSRPLAVSR